MARKFGLKMSLAIVLLLCMSTAYSFSERGVIEGAVSDFESDELDLEEMKRDTSGKKIAVKQLFSSQLVVSFMKFSQKTYQCCNRRCIGFEFWWACIYTWAQWWCFSNLANYKYTR